MNHKRKAFTLIEILVSISLLSLIILVVNRIYFSVSDSQIRISNENFVQSDLEYFTRLISNNIKESQRGNGILCAISDGKFFDLNASSSAIAFIKDGECLEFYWFDDDGVGRIRMADSISGTDQFITSSKTNVLSLIFVVEDNKEIGQPLVTMLVKAAPISDVNNFVYIQSSVSVLENVTELPVHNWSCGDLIYDLDCNGYETVQIGDQCWMAKNLAYLPSVHSNAQFNTQGGSSLPGYGVYGYDGSDVPTAKALANYTTYGVLYNFYAVAQTGENAICPSGWHVPTIDEWITLATYLGGTSVAGGKMKQTGTSLWSSPNTGATNESGFTVLPAGYRRTNGSFDNVSYNAFFWSSSVDGSDAWYRSLFFNNTGVSANNDSQASGFSLRCLKDQD